MSTINSKTMKIFSQNSVNFEILKVIKDNPLVTINRISEITGYSIPKTSVIVNELYNLKLLKISGSKKINRGRSPKLFIINPEICYIIGIDIGGENIRILITNYNGEVVISTKLETKPEENDKIIKRIFSKIDNLLLSSKINVDQIKGIGISVSGIIDAKKGVVLSSTNIGWNDIHIKKEFEQKFQLPVSIETSERAMAYAEKTIGVAKNYKDFIYIAFGIGIGCSIYINNNMYRGPNGFDGEIGHIIIDKDGPLCRCGNHGCLEALASSKSIINKAKELIEKGVLSSISMRDEESLDKITLKMINQEAINGDKNAFKLIKESAELMGYAISSIMNVLGINIIILGGGGIRDGDIFINSLKGSIIEKTRSFIAKNMIILKTSLDEYSGAIGAALFIIDKLFYSREFLKTLFHEKQTLKS